MAMLRTQHTGFTLVELLMVLTIAGILVATGMPALGSMLARSHRQSAEGALEASLMHARETAIVRNLRVIVCPSSDGSSCSGGTDWQHGWLIAPDADADDVPDKTSTPLAVFDAMPAGMHIVASRGRPRIVFHPDGSAGGSNARITVCHTGDTREGRAVIIANSGRVRVSAAQPEQLQECLSGRS